MQISRHILKTQGWTERINYFRWNDSFGKLTSLQTSFDACPHPRLLINDDWSPRGDHSVNFVNDRQRGPPRGRGVHEEGENS